MCRVWIPDVVGDGPNADSNLISVASLLHITGQSGDGERRPVDLGHEEPPQDDLVELGIRSPGQEPVQLHQKSQVDVLALGLSPTDFTVLVVADINTHDVFCNLTSEIIHISRRESSGDVLTVSFSIEIFSIFCSSQPHVRHTARIS